MLASFAAIPIAVVIAIVGFIERAGIDVDVRVEPSGRLRPVVRRDPLVVHAHELFGRDDVIVDGLLD